MKEITNHIVACALVSSMSVSIIASAAEYYKWTDENGVTHFSEMPPNNKKAEKIKTKSKPTTAEPKEDERKNGVEHESDSPSSEPPPSRAVSYKDPERCTTEKQRLTALQSNQRIKLKKKDGTTEFLDEAGIQREIAKTNKIISMVCE